MIRTMVGHPRSRRTMGKCIATFGNGAFAWPGRLDRKGALCHVLVRGATNSALIEFEDGARAIGSLNALRLAVTGVAETCQRRDAVTRIRCRREVSDSNETH
jgi:hypothetical protein